MKLDRELVRTLEELNILAKRTASGRLGTDRLGLRKGSSMEFADHRAYTPGDDVRAINWNLYAAQDQLFLKEFSAEEQIHVAVAVDVSRSMEGGECSKLDCAKLTAAALCYIGLSNYDTVSLYTFAGTLTPLRQFVRGKRMILDLLADLDAVDSLGTSDLAAVFRRPLPTLKGRGVLFVLSDLLDRDGWRTALAQLAASPWTTNILHVLSAEDVEPRGRGRLRLVDRESGREDVIDVSPGLAERYRAEFQRYLMSVEEAALEREMPYLRVMNDAPLSAVIVDVVRKGRMLGRKK